MERYAYACICVSNMICGGGNGNDDDNAKVNLLLNKATLNV